MLCGHSQVAWDAYKSFRNFCNAEFTRAKKQYTKRQQNTLQSETDGSRTWWTKAKRLSRISTPQTSLPTLKCPETDTIADTPPEKAELLANFFATKCTSPTPPMTFPVGAPYPLPEEHPMFDFPLITEHTVMRCLRRLPPSKSSGCSVLSHRVLRETAPAVCASLTYLYNLSIKTGTFPNDWKTAVVTPIFKNRGKTENPSNYRPISLLPAVGKILDHIQSQALCRRCFTNFYTCSTHRSQHASRLTSRNCPVAVVANRLMSVFHPQGRVAIQNLSFFIVHFYGTPFLLVCNASNPQPCSSIT